MLITLDNNKKIEVSSKLAIMPGHSTVLSVAKIDNKHRYILFSANLLEGNITPPTVKVTTDQLNKIFADQCELWLTRRGMHRIADVKEHKKLPKDNFWWSVDSKIKFKENSVKLSKCKMIDEETGEGYNDKFELSNIEFCDYFSAVVGPKIKKEVITLLINKGKTLLETEELIDIDQILTPKISQP